MIPKDFINPRGVVYEMTGHLIPEYNKKGMLGTKHAFLH